MGIESLNTYKKNKALWSWRFENAERKAEILETIENLSTNDLIRNVDKREVYRKTVFM